MKKLLFISNVTNKITNFTIPSIIASQSLGYEFHLAANLSGFKDNSNNYNVKLHHINIIRNPLNFKNIKAYMEILTLIKNDKIDVIHCNTPIGGILGRLCGRNSKVPKIIYTAHGFHFYKGAPLKNRTIFKWAEKWLAHYTDAIITINQEDYQAAKEFKLRSNGKVYYVPGVGIDTLVISQASSKREELLKEIGADEDSILLISIGELNKNKNNKTIVKSLKNIKNNKIHFLLCGTGNRKEEINSLIKDHNIEKNVHFLGYRSDIPQLLKSCDIFVMSSYREGLSRSIMEAMSAGLPCIVSKIRGNSDLIIDGEGGFLCNPDDVEGFSEAINILSADKVVRASMGAYNQNIVKKFDVENVKNEMQKIYQHEIT